MKVGLKNGQLRKVQKYKFWLLIYIWKYWWKYIYSMKYVFSFYSTQKLMPISILSTAKISMYDKDRK